MTATLTQVAQARPKGKPIEFEYEHFELAFEHLRCLEHDEEALEKAFHALGHMRNQMGRLESFIHARLQRMREVLKPEAQRFVQVANARCTKRK